MFVRPGTTLLTAFFCLVMVMPAAGVVPKRGALVSSSNGVGQPTDCFITDANGDPATPLIARLDGHNESCQFPTPQTISYPDLATSIVVNSHYTLTLTPILWLNGLNGTSRSILEVKLTADSVAPVPALTLQTLALKNQLEDLVYVPCSLPSAANDDSNPNGSNFPACMNSPEMVIPQFFPPVPPAHYSSDDLLLREPDIVVDSLNNLTVTVVDFSTIPTQNNSAVAYLGLSGVPSGGLDAANHFLAAAGFGPLNEPNSLDVSTMANFHAVLVDATGDRTEVGLLTLPYPSCTPAGTTCSAPPNDSANTPTAVNSENFTDFIDVSKATVQDDDDPPSICYSEGNPNPPFVSGAQFKTFRTVWYKLSSQGAGSINISTDGSRFDTRVDVFQSATKPGPLAASLACDDDFPANGAGPTQLQAKLQGVALAAHQTYWVMVSESAKPTGTLLDPTGSPEPDSTGTFMTGAIPFASSAVLNVSIKTVGLDSDKSTLTFASQTVNTTSPSQRITLTAQNGTVGSIVPTPAGDFSVSASTCTTVASGGTCTIDVKFSPTAAGSRAGNLQITSNAVLGPINVSLSGVGQGSSGATLSTNTLAFGNQLVGTTSAVQTVTLTNSGTGMLNISGLSIAPSGPFAIASGSSCQGLATLADGGTCTINVTYTPSAVGAAPLTSLSIVDDASNSPQTVSLTGLERISW